MRAERVVKRNRMRDQLRILKAERAQGTVIARALAFIERANMEGYAAGFKAGQEQKPATPEGNVQNIDKAT